MIFNMKRELNYNGKVYTSLKKLCDDTGISYSGLAWYICRKKGKNLKDIQNDEEVIEYLSEYNKLKEGDMRRGNQRVKGGILLGDKLYTSAVDACIDAGVSYGSFCTFCRKVRCKDICDLSPVERGVLLGEYVKSKGISYKGKVGISYKGKVYKNVKRMCESEGVSYTGFLRYYKKVYGNSPVKIGSCSLENALIDYMGLKNNTSPCAIAYKGKNYSSTLCACKEVGISRTSFTSFCSRVTGKVSHELSMEERSKLFETYAREKVNTHMMLSDVERVKNNGMKLQYIENQTHEICMEAVKQNGLALQFVKNQTEEICLEAVKQNWDALKYVKKQTEEICLEALKGSSLALLYVKDKTPKICLTAVQSESDVIVRMRNSDGESYGIRTRHKGDAIRSFEEQTPELCIASVLQDGMNLRSIKEQTPEVCMAAVMQNGLALRYVEKQTPMICLAAIQQNPEAREYVKIDI